MDHRTAVARVRADLVTAAVDPPRLEVVVLDDGTLAADPAWRAWIPADQDGPVRVLRLAENLTALDAGDEEELCVQVAELVQQHVVDLTRRPWPTAGPLGVVLTPVLDGGGRAVWAGRGVPSRPVGGLAPGV
ncbi:hypothetical protein [Cellulomonas sp. C5510]|uniref:hypothetical protein n=1 Tax=Cellulomonas sp. C5510 TaxID=2871170 RepID=UPI001C98DA94|nr:hypothetical protein [Cellulomonas sp. C5510]QZN85626.1 hypothetical protein K5O09_18160 [Cellulomonas sp. C5510]